MPDAMEHEITQAVGLIRQPLARQRQPAEMRAVHRRQSLYTRPELAMLAGACLLSGMVTMVAVLVGGEVAAAISVAIVALFAKPSAEASRLFAFAVLGAVAGSAKALQSVVDGAPQSRAVVSASIVVAMIFSVVGGLAADASHIDPKMSLVIAFVVGVLGFRVLVLIESKVLGK